MTTELRDSLAQVQRLCDDIRFTASNCNSDDYNRLMNKLAIDSWEFFYRHGSELMKRLEGKDQ